MIEQQSDAADHLAAMSVTARAARGSAVSDSEESVADEASAEDEQSSDRSECEETDHAKKRHKQVPREALAQDRLPPVTGALIDAAGDGRLPAATACPRLNSLTDSFCHI